MLAILNDKNFSRRHQKKTKRAWKELDLADLVNPKHPNSHVRNCPPCFWFKAWSCRHGWNVEPEGALNTASDLLCWSAQPKSRPNLVTGKWSQVESWEVEEEKDMKDKKHIQKNNKQILSCLILPYFTNKDWHMNKTGLCVFACLDQRWPQKTRLVKR